MTAKAMKARWRFFFRYFLPGLVLFSFLFYVFFLRQEIENFKESNAILKARALGLSLFQYANDNNGKYPEGKSSTEIFQKLLDGGYLHDQGNGDDSAGLDDLYYPIPGKVKAAPGTKILKPENICWDVTCCMDTASSDKLPVLFLTGYKITYQAGASAIPLPHPARTWSDWWHGRDYPTKFIAVIYMSNSSQALKASPDGTVPNFIPADFDAKGKTYRQLTPDGELPP